MACAEHVDREEAFACTACAKRWCESCARPVGVTAHFVCPACGHEVKRARAKLDDDSLIRDAVKRVLSLDAAITAAAFAVMWGLGSVFTVLNVLYLAALVSYYFAIVRHVGDGKSGLPGPSDSTEDWWEIGGFALRGILAASLGFVPLLAYVMLAGEPPIDLAIVLAIAGQAIVPSALLAMVVSNNGLAVVWPVAWLGVIARAPRAYAWFVGTWVASVVVGVAICALTVTLLMPIAWIGSWLAATVWALYWFAQAGLVGNFLRNHADELGWN